MIGVVARHESAAQLRAGSSWLIGAALAGLLGYLFLRQLEGWLGVQAQLALQDHPPGLTGFLAARFLAPLAMLFSLVAPLFAMRAFSDEYRLSTFALWQSSPVADGALVLGKFLGALVVPLALVGLALVMLGSMAAFVDVDEGALLAGGLGLVLSTAACTATGLYFSSLTRQATIAILSALALLALLWLIGSASELPGAGTRAGASLDALRPLAIGERLGGFFQGYVRSGDVLYFVLMIALFLALTRIRLGALRRAGDGAPGARLPLVLSLLAVGIALALGWFATRFSGAVDVTANARHSLSPTSLEAARALDAPLEVIAVLEPDPATREALEALLARFAEAKPDIALEIVNPDTDPARARRLGAAPGGELILRAGEREQRLATLSERALAGALRRLGRERARDIAFVTGHEERSPVANGNDDWAELAARLASGGLLARELSLVTEPRVADSVDVLVLAAPRRPWFPGEVASLLEYVRGGGNLLWLSETPTGTGGAADEGLREGSATGPGLDALAVELGVETLPGRVIDTASQTLDAGSPDFVLLDRFPAHPVTGALASPLLLPQARALAAVPLAGQTLLPLLQTPESSWTESGALEGAVRFDEGGGEVAGPLLLGVTIERLPGPDEGGGDGRGGPTQRIAVLGDADFAASRFLGNGANAAFAESLLLWLAGDDAALDFVTRPAPDAELVLDDRARIVLGVTWLAAVPLAFALVALGLRLRRAREGRRAGAA